MSARFSSGKTFTRLQGCDRKLALIIGHKFPSVVHQSPVEVRVPSGVYQSHLEYVSPVPKLSAANFNAIIKFQTSLIPTVLKCRSQWARVVPEAAEFLIVVLDASSQIDLEFMVSASAEQPTSDPGETEAFEVGEISF